MFGPEPELTLRLITNRQAEAASQQERAALARTANEVLNVAPGSYFAMQAANAGAIPLLTKTEVARGLAILETIRQNSPWERQLRELKRRGC